MNKLSVRKDKKNATYDGIGSAMTISIRICPSKSVGVTQSGEDCSRSLFIGKSHGDNRKTHQLKKDRISTFLFTIQIQIFLYIFYHNGLKYFLKLVVLCNKASAIFIISIVLLYDCAMM